VSDQLTSPDAGLAIQVSGLSKYYGPFVALRDVSFDIPAGQIVALLGPNGAGKSTTMKILTGFLAASSGSASLAGWDIATDRLKAAEHLGYLPENGPVYLDMTPLQTLRFLGEARGLSRDVLRTRIADTAVQCGLDNILEKPISKLSKGLRQRVALAQALLHNPAVVIMDEPTAGLDPNQIREFRTLVRSFSPRKTLLISTHILQEVQALADRVLLMHAGRLVFDGSPADLLEEGSLEAQFHRLTRSHEADA
jgi:ABC-2 type transport system ATP-binding protein